MKCARCNKSIKEPAFVEPNIFGENLAYHYECGLAAMNQKAYYKVENGVRVPFLETP